MQHAEINNTVQQPEGLPSHRSGMMRQVSDFLRLIGATVEIDTKDGPTVGGILLDLSDSGRHLILDTARGEGVGARTRRLSTRVGIQDIAILQVIGYPPDQIVDRGFPGAPDDTRVFQEGQGDAVRSAKRSEPAGITRTPGGQNRLADIEKETPERFSGKRSTRSGDATPCGLRWLLHVVLFAVAGVLLWFAFNHRLAFEAYPLFIILLPGIVALLAVRWVAGEHH